MGGGSRNYQTDNDDACSSSSSGAGSDINTCGSKNAKRYPVIYKLKTAATTKLSTAAVPGATTINLATTTDATRQLAPPSRARPVRQRVMCRCCLSEQLPPRGAAAAVYSTGSDCDSELDEALPAAKFVPLDTIAMVELCEDLKNGLAVGLETGKRRASSNSSSSTAQPDTTLLDCLNACARIGASFADIELPQHICLDCCHTLETCCEFIRCVRNADKILRRRCALPAKRARLSMSSAATAQDVASDWGPSNRRMCREEKLQPLQQVGGVERNCIVVAGVGNAENEAHTPNRCHPTISWTEEQVELDFTALDAEQTFVRSFDSGIETIDEDQISVKFSDCGGGTNDIVSSNKSQIDNNNGCCLVEYDGYTYVVAEALSNDLERFHRSSHQHMATRQPSYKCGFCVFECDAKHDLNKHLQKHLGAPQHNCEQCSFACHFKYLLTQHQQATGHGNGTFRNNQSKVQNASSEVGGEPTRYHCHLCPECFVNYDALQQHRKSHKVYCRCTVCCFKSSTRENVLEHMAKEHKLFVERRLIVKYIPLQRINSEPLLEQSPWQSNCTKAELYTVKQERQSTPTIKDNKYRKHLCQFCGKCFDRRFHLLKHEYNIHSLNRPTTTHSSELLKSSAAMHTKHHAKLKYLRQRKAVQAARFQRSVDGQLPRQQEQLTSSRFECDICSAVFMFNFELKYHLRTHKSIDTAPSDGTTQQRAPDKLETTPAVSTKAVEELLSPQVETAVEHLCEDARSNGKLEAKSGKPAAKRADWEQKLPDTVTKNTSPLKSLDTSPTSSNNSYDINYDDQLYLNDFDLGLLDCEVGFPSF